MKHHTKTTTTIEHSSAGLTTGKHVAQSTCILLAALLLLGLFYKVLEFLVLRISSFFRNRREAKERAELLTKSKEAIRLDTNLDELDIKDKPPELNEEQGRAWAAREEKLLTVACAGAGKTRLAVARAQMLVALGVPIDRLLFLTFSKNATETMIERLSEAFGIKAEEFRKKKPLVPVPKVTTIHKFSMNLLESVGIKFKLIDMDVKWYRNAYRLAWKSKIQPILESNSNGDGFRLLSLLHRRDYEQVGQTFDFEQEDIHGEGKIETSVGLKVRSKAEQRIAEWLVSQGIKFEYERPVIWADFPFKPDFYLPDYGLYIEYLGLWDYRESEDKRNLYRKHFLEKKKQFNKRGLLRNLLEIYPKNVDSFAEFNPWRKSASFKDIVKGALVYAPGFKEIQDLETKCLGALKSQSDQLVKTCYQIRIDIQKNDVPIEQLPIGRFEKEVVGLVMKLAKSIEDELVEPETGTKLFDLDEIIFKTAELTNTQRKTLAEALAGTEYVFLDEFQDVYPLLFKLLRPILDSKKFFAIGDERQAIYGFLGSTPRYIRNLPTLVLGTVTYALQTNYRSTPEIVTFSESVLPKGIPPAQAIQPSGGKAQVWELTSEEREAETLLRRLHAEEPINELMVLNFYNAGEQKTDKTMSAWHKAAQDYPGKGYMTFHKSKGLESETVVVTGLVESNDRACFPNRAKDHPIIAAIKRAGGQNDSAAENRRLLYVAMSRAEKRLIVVTERGKRSSLLANVSEHVLRSLEEMTTA